MDRCTRETDGMKFVRDMKIGWNLGNTFDAITNAQKEDDLSIEWSWCGEKTTKEMIDAEKAAGFKTLRLPVSWHNHVSGDHYTISEAWLDRVQEVLDYAVDDDMYVILNIHHDTALQISVFIPGTKLSDHDRDLILIYFAYSFSIIWSISLVLVFSEALN